ncbi:MAG: alpha-hydroxy-acid oxidizing protein [Deinococcales bacterium]
MLAHPQHKTSFLVRDVAPDILLIGNLGVAQLNKGFGEKEVKLAIESIGADALALHTNPLQEAMQFEGDGDFSALIPKISQLSQDVPYPLLLKEVGHGLSGEVAWALRESGLAAFDVAGAGGTSWAKVEAFARYGELRFKELCEWGIPTAKALADIHQLLPEMPLIASGGIRSGVDAAKALMMGASVIAMARPLLKAAIESSKAVIEYLESFIWELRVAMHCMGAKDLAALKKLNFKTHP